MRDRDAPAPFADGATFGIFDLVKVEDHDKLRAIVLEEATDLTG